MSSLNSSDKTNALGNNLKKARKALKMTQSAFAKPLGITGGYISYIENGKTINPSEPVLNLIESHYKIRRDWLFTGEGEMFSIASEEEPKPEPSTRTKSSQIQIGLLAQVINGVDSELDKQNLAPDHLKKAQLIALLYEYLMETGKEMTQQKIADYIKLVS